MSSVVFFGYKSEHSVAKTGEITKNDVKPSGRSTSYAHFASPLKFLKSVRRSIAPQPLRQQNWHSEFSAVWAYIVKARKNATNTAKTRKPPKTTEKSISTP